MCLHSQPFSSAFKRYDFPKTKIWRQTVEDEQIYKIFFAIPYQYLECYTWGTLPTPLDKLAYYFFWKK